MKEWMSSKDENKPYDSKSKQPIDHVQGSESSQACEVILSNEDNKYIPSHRIEDEISSKSKNGSLNGGKELVMHTYNITNQCSPSGDDDDLISRIISTKNTREHVRGAQPAPHSLGSAYSFNELKKEVCG